MESSRLVILEGGLPWGFRIQGGCDTGFPLRIARVNPGSKAALQGIREGDLITSINDRSTEGPVTNQEAHGLLKEAGPTLRLGLKQGSSLSRRLLNKSSPSPSATSNGNSSESQIFNFAGGADGQLLTNSGAGSSSKQPLFSNNKTGSSSTSVLSTAYTASSPKPGVWSPGQASPPQRDTSDTPKGESAIGDSNQDHQPPVWIPASQQPSPRLERKEFRPVRLDTAALNKKQQEGDWSPKSSSSSSGKPAAPSSLPPLLLSSWEKHRSSSQPQQPHNAQQQTPLIAPTSTASASSTPLNTPASDHSASALTSTSTNYSVLSWDRRTTASSNYSGGGSGSTTPTPSIHPLLSQQTTSTPTSHLPKAPNPTVTLLQKAREGQLPKGAAYLDSASSSGKPGPVVPAAPPQQPLYRTPYEQAYSFQREYSSSGSTADGNNLERRKVGDLTSNKFSGTGSNSQEGVPVPLRSNVREEDHHQWYRRMYESLHKQGGPSDYVTIRYKAGKGRGGGYQSEPDQGRQSSRYDYDSDAGRYATLDRRRQRIHNDSESNGSPSRTIGEADLYRIQPGRIEDYVPGVRSSITQPVQSSPKQAQRNLNIPSKSFTNFALKESGYESDSQLVFRRRYPTEPGGEANLASPATDPQEQRVWYRDIQRGGEVPLHGLRKPQPERSQVASWFGGNKRRTVNPWRYIRFKSKSKQQNSNPSNRRLRFLSVPAALSSRFSRFRKRMFRSGPKRSSGESKTPPSSTPGSPSGNGSSSKGKTWRRIKPSITRKGSSSKTATSPSPPSPSDGGFLPLKDSGNSSEPEASTSFSNQQNEDQIEDMMVPMSPPIPPPPPSSNIAPARPPRQPRSGKRSNPLPTLPAFPAFPTLPPLKNRPAKKQSSASSSKSEPALNVYLQQRQAVTGSKFRQAELKKSEDEPEPKMSRYQKLARDTKNLVARLSGEIPSPEKIRQALKIPSESNENSAGQDETDPEKDPVIAAAEAVDVTDPEFTCDEQTAAILLAELEGTTQQNEKVKPSAGPECPPRRKRTPPVQEQEQQQQKQQQQQQEQRSEDVIYANSPEPTEYYAVTAQRFAQLRSLYRSLERLNQLERTVSGNELNRLGTSDGVIDFDLWRRIRQHERAQEEMRHLATWIQAAQREGECYFSASPPNKWPGTDPGLRIKEQSVRDLTDKFSNISEHSVRHHEYSTQSLPRNFTTASIPSQSRPDSAVSSNATSPTPGRPSRSSQRRCSLTGQQMAQLKSQLARVYAHKSDTSNTDKKRPTPSKLPENLLNPKLYVRSSSESGRDLTLACLEQRRARIMASQKALSIASGGRTTPSSAPVVRRSHSVSETERRNLSARLSAEVKKRHQQHQSTRTAIQYVQQLSRSMTSHMNAPGSSRGSPTRSSADRTRSSSRESSASSNQDYLLVLTPRARDQAEVASVVHEWAQNQKSARPTLPLRSSSLVGRAEEESNSSNSSVQTVIQRDVQQKVDFFEKVIAESSDPTEAGVVPFRSVSKSVNDLRRSSSSISQIRRRSCSSRSITPQRSQSLSVRPISSCYSGGGSAADLRFSQLMERLRTPSPSSGSRGNYLNLVKRGDVDKKCQYFIQASSSQQQQHQRPSSRPSSRSTTPQLSSRSVPDSLPLWSAAEKFNRNKTVIKGQEMGDVSYIKRRYEQQHGQPFLAGGRYSQSTPTLTPGWRARLAAAASKKQVSFPFMFNKTGRNGKRLDFTRVKPTLLSSARLALRQAQTASNPHLQHNHRRSRSGSGHGSVSDIASDKASSVTSKTSGNKSGLATTSPLSIRSASQGSVCSRRSMNSPLPPLPVASNKTSTPPSSSAPVTQDSKQSTVNVENDYAPVDAGGSSNTTAQQFDPSLHQPTYRYTPPPPRAGGRPNRIHSVYDLYATYPRRSIQPSTSSTPNRPPLPAEWTADRRQQKGAAHRFLESEVTINYRRPIRSLQQGGHQQLGEMDEEELRQLQAEHMKRVYEQERRRKYLQELEDIESRRHMDNFTPLMKSPIPLNRYDDFMDDQPVSSGLLSGRQSQQVSHQRERTPEPKIVARGLYNFVAQNARELSFHKGDIIFVRRQIDKNWYEGEHNAMIGIFPVNYVEIIPYDGVRMTNRKPSEGKGRVKFNFVAQTPVELSLVKGEMVIITRQVDEHWLEGRIGQRRGIFPISYIDVIQPSSSQLSDFTKTPAQATGGSSMITNGSLRTATNYRSQPQYASLPKMSPMNPPVTNQYQQQYRSGAGYKPSPLMVDTRSSEPVMYRALYTYVPQNEDELELQEGESICVLEKCDDGWYVGTSQRTGLFGTFPGNYVERI